MKKLCLMVCWVMLNWSTLSTSIFWIFWLSVPKCHFLTTSSMGKCARKQTWVVIKKEWGQKVIEIKRNNPEVSLFHYEPNWNENETVKYCCDCRAPWLAHTDTGVFLRKALDMVSCFPSPCHISKDLVCAHWRVRWAGEVKTNVTKSWRKTQKKATHNTPWPDNTSW